MAQVRETELLTRDIELDVQCTLKELAHEKVRGQVVVPYDDGAPGPWHRMFVNAK